MYENLKHKDEYSIFLLAALQDLGYDASFWDSDGLRIKDKNGNVRELSESSIYFLMGATVGVIGKYLEETK